MPVSYLSPAQKARYVAFPEPLAADYLARHAYLNATDRAVIASLRADHTRLGYAVQLVTVRCLGTFLDDPTAVPADLLSYLTQQLGLSSADFADAYSGRMRHYHAEAIRERYSYALYNDRAARLPFLRWLFARAWISTERPSLLFDHAVGWLTSRKILLPGISVLAREVARVREQASLRLYSALARLIPSSSQSQLDALLLTPADAEFSSFEQLRRIPTTPSTNGLRDAIAHLVTIRAVGVSQLRLPQLPLSRIEVLARQALQLRASSIARMEPPARRIATLFAAVHLLEATTHDTILETLDGVVTALLTDAFREGIKIRLRSLHDLDQAALTLAAVAEVLLDGAVADAAVRTTVACEYDTEALETAIAQVRALARPPADTTYEALKARSKTLSIFRPALLTHVQLQALPAGKAVLSAYQYLQAKEGKKRQGFFDAPRQVITNEWRPYVLPDDRTVDRLAYTFCVMDRLVAALRRRELFVTPSLRFSDPGAGLLSGAAWEATRPQVCRALSMSADGATAVGELAKRLDTAYRTTLARLPDNTAVRITATPKGHDELVLSPLERLDEPQSLLTLRAQTSAMLPHGDLPDILLEVHRRTGFLDAFTHVSERAAALSKLPTSLCAVLIAAACNVGFAPLLAPGAPELGRDRLSYVQQHYVRSETLEAANAMLVGAHSQSPVAQLWGGGDVASADGLRFVVPLRTIHAGKNPRYFGIERGVTWYNLVADQGIGLHGVVVTGTLRDSLILLSLLLGQQTPLQPTEIMTDTGAYTDSMFGLLWLLGFQFSPRLSDVGATRLWRIDRAADYGMLNDLSRHPIRTQLIVDHWDDLLRLAGSLSTGTAQTESLVRTLQRGDRPTKMGRALQELGRVIKTLFVLNYIDDEAYRRRILTQLNRGEGRNKLARVVFYGQRGELRQRYREGQENQLTALGLVVNAIIVWNTLYLERALDALRAAGHTVRDEDVARLSPLVHEHVNVLGRYSFSLPEDLQRGAWRPFRVPVPRQ